MHKRKTIHREVHAITCSLALLSHGSETTEEELDAYAAKHLMGLVRTDIENRIEVIESAAQEMFGQLLTDANTIKQQTADGLRAIVMDARVDEALTLLKTAMDSMVTVTVHIDQESDLRNYAADAACRMSAAMRALQGQGEYERLNITGKKCA